MVCSWGSGDEYVIYSLAFLICCLNKTKRYLVQDREKIGTYSLNYYILECVLLRI